MTGRSILLLLVLMAQSASAESLREQVMAAAPGDTVFVTGVHSLEEPIIIDRRLVLMGIDSPVLDGQGRTGIFEVVADGVQISGLVFRNTGITFMEDRAALRATSVVDCHFSNNRFENTFFGIYLSEVQACLVDNNAFIGVPDREVNGGNAIHSWNSRTLRIQNNVISGHRDGIYLEFTTDSEVLRNVSSDNLRYGLHFMFSDRCSYAENRFLRNGAGVAVMYADDVTMKGNEFSDSWGASSFGLLLKEIKGGQISENTFVGNSIALFVESSDRLTFENNRFERNGWAIRVMADARSNVFRSNTFLRNTFDVTTNSRKASGSLFEENFWDRYRGYDLDRDGFGDIPFHPVRLYAFLVEKHEPSLILLRSAFVSSLDLVEAIAPIFTPEMLVDSRPAMKLPPPASKPSP